MRVTSSKLDDGAGFIAGLEALGLDELRDVWRQRLGPPPPLRSIDLLRHLLAWRLQAESQGGLSLETRNALTASPSKLRASRLSDGARLSREWQGRRHDVERTTDGFRYNNQTYRSLSEVARAITGVRWNGPRFFGLRKETAA